MSPWFEINLMANIGTWILAGLVIGVAQSGDDVAAKIAAARKRLEPRPATLPPGQYTTPDFLAALEKQTGNIVGDRRGEKSIAKVQLDVNGLPFWQALDRFCTAAGCGYSVYGSAGGVALIDGGRRSPHVSYHGITRTAVKRVTVANHLDTGVATCAVLLDVAWEPRFQPFYLGVGPVEAQWAAPETAKTAKFNAPGRGQLPVAGRSASEVELLLAAPPRQARTIASLEGTVTLLGPSKMLAFRFPELKEGVLEQEEVTVRVLDVKQGLDRWQVDVQIDNPEGTPTFDSYQSWLNNNRIELVRGAGAKRQVWLPEPNEAIDENQRRARITYSFAATPAKGKPGDWALIYRTPGRMVELVVPYRFKDVPLR